VRSLPVRLKLSDRITGSFRRSDQPSMAQMKRRPSLQFIVQSVVCSRHTPTQPPKKSTHSTHSFAA